MSLRRWVSRGAQALVIGLGTLVLTALPALAQDPSVVKTAPATAAPGATISYNIVVSNAVGDTATGVTMTDVLPASTTFVSATTTQGACAGTTTVICNLGNLGSAASATVVIQVTIAAGAAGAIANTATIASGGPDIGPPGNNTSTAITTIPAATGGGTPTDSTRLAAMQAAAAKQAAQGAGAAIGGAVDGAIGEAFSGGGDAVTLGPNGARINFAAEETPRRVPDAFAAFGPTGAPLRSQREWFAWVEIRSTSFQPRSYTAAPALAGNDLRGNQVHALAGLSRKLTPDLVVGAFAGYERFDSVSDSLTARLTGDGWTLGGYVGWRVLPALRIDGGLARSAITYGSTAGTAAGSFGGIRWLAMAGVTGNTTWQTLTVEPSVRFHMLWEGEDSYIDSLGTSQVARNFSLGRTSAGAKFSRTLPWTSSVSLTPYLGLYGDYYFNSEDARIVTGLPALIVLDGWSARATGGVSIDLAGGQKLALGGELGGLGSPMYLWSLRARAMVPF